MPVHAAFKAAVVLTLVLACQVARAQDVPLATIHEQADTAVMEEIKSFKGDPVRLPIALAESGLPRKLEDIYGQNWRAVREKIEQDLSVLPDVDSAGLQPPVKVYDLSMLADHSIAYRTLSDGMLLLLRFDNVTRAAQFAAHVVLPAYLAETNADQKEFARNSIASGFLRMGVFRTKVGTAPALGTHYGDWIVLSTYERSERGLIKPLRISLHPKDKDK
jgi:hypothetical protein